MRVLDEVGIPFPDVRLERTWDDTPSVRAVGRVANKSNWVCSLSSKDFYRPTIVMPQGNRVS